MDSAEKKKLTNLLIGAFTTAGVKMGLEAWFVYNGGKGTPLDGQFPYVSVGTPYLPPADVWIADVGVPALFYLLGKGMKKPSLVQMSQGGAIYGVSEITGITLYRTVAQTQASARYVLANRRI